MAEKKNFLHPMITRRDFLSQGVIPFSTAMLFPSFDFLLNKARAEEDCGTAVSSIPFLVFDCAGGAALPANFLVTDRKGELLPKYDLLGWDPVKGGVDKSFGIGMAQTDSKILQGINNTASAEARKNFRMGAFCHSAQSDNSSNPLSAITLLQKWGYKGTRLVPGAGVVNNASGGNSSTAFPDPALKTVFVKSVSDLVNSVGFPKDNPFGKASSTQLSQFMKAASSLNDDQLSKIESLPGGKLFSKLVRCSFQSNEKNVAGGNAEFDARLDPLFQQIYQINNQTNPELQAPVFASIVKGVLTGNIGPSVLTIGDCDYHNNSQEKGDTKDLEIGTYIGRAVQAAHQMKKPLFFQIITDGGCSNQQGTRIWVSDDNDKCMTVVGYYRPDGPPTMRKTQVGHYTAGQSADLDALTGIGKSPLKVACSAFANYLSLHVPEKDFQNEFRRIVPSGDIFANDDEVRETLLFG